MQWKENSGSGGFSVEDGVYDAVCIGIIDMGTQHSEYNGEEKIKRECIIEWELLDEFIEVDGEEVRATVSQFYTQSLDPRATLRIHLKGWRGQDFTAEELEGFDPKNILGKNCKLTVGVKPNGRNKIEAISRWKGETQQANAPLTYFMLTDNDGNITFDGKFPDEISEGRINIIKKSDEYNKWADQFNGGATDDDVDQSAVFDDSEIPF